MIDPKEIEKLAVLARLELSPEETQTLSENINSILSYVGQVKEVAGDDVADTPSGIFAELKNTMRQDGEPHPSGEFSEELLNEVPSREGDFVKVKKIL